MKSRNVVDKAMVRAYLLRTLDDETADSLEMKYFTDRDSLVQLKAIESDLIRDYFRGRLTSSERQRFEQAYLQTAELRGRVAEVRAAMGNLRPMGSARPLSWWRPLLASCCLLLIAGGAWYVSRSPGIKTPQTAVVKSAGTAAVASLFLHPGLVKGALSQVPSLVVPRAGGSVSITLDLPGDDAPLDCKVEVSVADAEGRWVPVWMSSTPIRSHSDDAGGRVAGFSLDSHLLRRGDYRVEVSGADNQTLDTYLFRVLG
ncbi:MAG: hypothetical protein JO323_14210 [Acidobacteriia bacterium]|nr:hypothetical protein [Terriglobia bacterium]